MKIRNEDLQPIVVGWVGKINQAIERKAPFQDVADQCMSFFSEASGFLWQGKHHKRYFNGNVTPTFKITLQKAFELVAVFGPTLYWNNPQRVCRPRETYDLPPQFFEQMADPMLVQAYQASRAQRERGAAHAWVRSQLMQAYLNYTPGEQPGEGLAGAAELAITEALVKGRGLLWQAPYQMPGSDRVLTGSFYDSVDNFLIDPDAETLQEAWWICQRVVAPIWQVEREYGLPKGLLEGHGSQESSWAQGESTANDLASYHRATGQTYDNIVYYKIWSKGGLGARLSGVETPALRSIDKAVGDFAFLVIAPGVPFPLNAHPERIRRAGGLEGTADDVRDEGLFDWPLPTWTDDRWPCTTIDFYRKPRSVWPIAPMAPGLGELIFMNVTLSSLADRIYASSKDIIAVMEQAADEVKTALANPGVNTVISLSNVLEDINKHISVFQRPQVNQDIWIILQEMGVNFEKRVGLYENLYARNPEGTQPRTATESKQKERAAGIRPEYMAKKVEAWMGETARNERFAARWYVEGRDVAPLLGRDGAMLWDRMISSMPVDLVVREMDVTIEAGSGRKPNKDRELDNLNAMTPTLLPLLIQYAQTTTDTRPVNRFFNVWGNSLGMKEVKDLQLGPFAPPPPPPEMQQQMQMQQQLEMAKLQADLQKAQAAVQKSQIDAQAKAQQSQMKMAEGQQKLQADQQKQQLDSRNRVMEFLQKSRFDQEDHVREAGQDTERHMMEMLFDADEHEQEMDQKEEMGSLELELKRKQAAAQRSAAKQPQTNGAK